MEPDAPVSAGSIAAMVGPGLQLRDIRLETNRALDAIYFSVRDSTWHTIAETVERQTLRRTEGGFSYVVVLRHTAESIDIRTTASVIGTKDRVEITSSAEALIDQKVNRVSLCVLHPLELTAHAVVLRTDQGTRRSHFPTHITPHQAFRRLRGMSEMIVPDIQLEIDFEGGIFETEDHRNWTDAGWKTYSPPLENPHPFELRTGEVLRQRIVLQPRVGPEVHATPDLPARVTVGDEARGRLPRIGFGVSGRDVADQSRAEMLLLSPAFLLVELSSGPENIGRFEQALDEARSLHTSLNVLLACGLEHIREWGLRFRDHAEDIAAVTVVEPDSHVSTQVVIDELLSTLGTTSIEVGAGTRGYFAELNRSISHIGTADFLCFTVSPEVHHSDDERVCDTLRALQSVLRDAQRLRPGVPVVVGPITLRQRLNLEGESGDYAPFSARLLADPRTREQFAAAWVVGAIAGLADAKSLAFFTVDGPGGVLDGTSLTPAGQVFAVLARYREATLVECEVSDPRLIGALAIRAIGGDQLLLLANYRPNDIEVTVDFLGTSRQVVLRPYQVQFL